jgi:hypothetical protein
MKMRQSITILALEPFRERRSLLQGMGIDKAQTLSQGERVCARVAMPYLNVATTILSGSFTGSPRLILSTFSMPEITLPQTVY